MPPPESQFNDCTLVTYVVNEELRLRGYRLHMSFPTGGHLVVQVRASAVLRVQPRECPLKMDRHCLNKCAGEVQRSADYLLVVPDISYLRRDQSCDNDVLATDAVGVLTGSCVTLLYTWGDPSST